MKNNCKKWAKYIPLSILLFVVAIFAFSYIVMSLWNWLVPELFSGPMITMWQAIGLLVLSKILLGSFSHRYCKCHKHHSSHIEWKNKCREIFKEHVSHTDEIKTTDSE